MKVEYTTIYLVRERVVTRRTFADDLLDLPPDAPLKTTRVESVGETDVKISVELVVVGDGTLVLREQWPQRPMASARLVPLRDERRRAALEAIVQRAEDPATCRALAQRCEECVPRRSYGNFVDPLKCWNGLVSLPRAERPE